MEKIKIKLNSKESLFKVINQNICIIIGGEELDKVIKLLSEYNFLENIPDSEEVSGYMLKVIDNVRQADYDNCKRFKINQLKLEGVVSENL